MAQWCRHYKVAIWAWCLMPNHIHLIAVPQTPEGLPRAHLAGENDELVNVAPLLDLVADWSQFLSLSSVEDLDLLHRHERTGRPMGAHGFVETLEQTLGRVLQPQKPGPKKKS
jgi:putative transposase